MLEKAEEKRRHPRFDFRIPMRYRRIDAHTRESKGSLIKNLSVGGARIAAYEFLPLNLKLAIEIPLTSGLKPVEGIGRVAWVSKAAFSDQYDVGVEFANLNEKDAQEIGKFIFDKNVEKVI